MKNFFLFIFFATSLSVLSQNSVVKKQMKAMDNFKNNADSFGKRGTTNINTKLTIDRDTKYIHYDSKHKQSKYVLNGRTYYNMSFHVNFSLNDVSSVYEVGNKIHFDINYRGFLMKAKAPRENWTSPKRIKQDYNITIYNSKLRKQTLKDLKFLVRNPKFRLN